MKLTTLVESISKSNSNLLIDLLSIEIVQVILTVVPTQVDKNAR